LAVAPRSHGAIREAIDAWPKLDISLESIDSGKSGAACDGLPASEVNLQIKQDSVLEDFNPKTVVISKQAEL
jgi:hypothetical protein